MAKNKDPFVLLSEKRLEGVSARIRINGYGVRTNDRECLLDVLLVGFDAAAILSVPNDHSLNGAVYVCDRFTRRVCACCSLSPIKCGIEFVDAGGLLGRVDNRTIEVDYG